MTPWHWFVAFLATLHAYAWGVWIGERRVRLEWEAERLRAMQERLGK